MAIPKSALLLFVASFTLYLFLPVFADTGGSPYIDEGAPTPRYCVVFPRRVRPGTPLAALVLWPGGGARSVSARLTRDGQEVAAATDALPPDVPATLLQLKVPVGAEAGRYALRVEGRRRGAGGGAAGGALFAQEAPLSFAPAFLAIMVQTTRPVYAGGQVVRFRVVLLTAEAKPYEDPVDVYVVDPDGLIMRRWVSMQNNNGVISHRFRLPRLPKDGEWRIRVRAHGQTEEQPIVVETFFPPLFEVHVWTPAFALDSQPDLLGHVCARSHLQRVTRGNVTLRLSARALPLPPPARAPAAGPTRYSTTTTTTTTSTTTPAPAPSAEFNTAWEHTAFLKEDGCYTVSVPLELAHQALATAPSGGPSASAGTSGLAGAELRLDAAVTDVFYGETARGFSHTRVVGGAVRLRFLGTRPHVFAPGAPFEGHVVVHHDDDEPLEARRLAEASLRVAVSARLRDGGVVTLPPVRLRGLHHADDADNEVDVDGDEDDDDVMNDGAAARRFRRDGVFRFRFMVPAEAARLELEAEYRDGEGGAARARATAVRAHSPSGRHLALRSSTTRAFHAEYAVFHAQADFPLDNFYYLVMSKGQVHAWGEQRVSPTRPSVATFAVPVAAAMTPALRVVALAVAADGELVAASADVPLAPFSQHKMRVRMNQGKDPTKRTAEAVTRAAAGAFMGLAAARAPAFAAQAGDAVTKARALQAFHRLDNDGTRVEWRVRWRARDGLRPDRVEFFPAPNAGVDANTTLAMAGLAVITDALVPRWPQPGGECEGEGMEACLTDGCFPTERRCDGRYDCADASDENECPSPTAREERHYRLSRISRTSDMYDLHGGDWGWREMNDEYGGEEFFRMRMPPVADDWFVTGFSVSKVKGFSTIDDPVPFSTERPFMFHLEGPSACRRGEQVGLRATLINNMDNEDLALLEVRGDERHRFVHVEEDGIVSSYGARLEPGDHHHLVYLPPRSQKHVDIPIAPAIEQGDISIVVSAMTQIGGFKRVHNMTVLAEGGLITKHSSVFLDLKNRALVLRYMAIFTDQSPLVPYQEWRRYIFGSTSASVTVSGDVLGPIFSQIPLTVQSVMGMELKGTEASSFELANNVWTLHYLRLTNQLTPRFARRVLEEVNVLLGEVMRRYNPRGWFQNWDSSAPSVWLTSWVIRTLKHGAFQDWEDYFYVQPDIFYNSVEWLLQFQSEAGYFNETREYYFPLDPKMRAVSGNTTDPVPLTAHVLITLSEVTQHIHGALKTTAHGAAIRAIRYLEHALPQITDPYSIAITAYALTLSGSSERDRAVRLLQTNRKKVDGLLYWARVDIPQNEIRYENQRPFMRPREHQEGDSLAVETTAYALLALLAWDGATIDAELVVQWLNSVRMSNNGFISSMDSAVGLQALTEYAFRARLLAVTDMSVTVDMPSSDVSIPSIHIGNMSIGSEQTMDVPNVWGHINVIARGSGQALAQMDVSFGIDKDTLVETPVVRCFEMRFREFYSTFRNKSAITVETCMRWILDDPPVSGAAVLELEMPTGYALLESEAIELAASQVHPTLRDGRTLEGKTAWYFDYIPQEWTCFNHTIRRWYPVGNMTQYRQAMLYEEYAREHFVHVIIKSTPLYLLNICEVCGSYQCPYCPHYSSAMHCLSSITVVLCSVILVLLKNHHRTVT